MNTILILISLSIASQPMDTFDKKYARDCIVDNNCDYVMACWVQYRDDKTFFDSEYLNVLKNAVGSDQLNLLHNYIAIKALNKWADYDICEKICSIKGLAESEHYFIYLELSSDNNCECTVKLIEKGIGQDSKNMNMPLLFYYRIVNNMVHKKQITSKLHDDEYKIYIIMGIEDSGRYLELEDIILDLMNDKNPRVRQLALSVYNRNTNNNPNDINILFLKDDENAQSALSYLSQSPYAIPAKPIIEHSYFLDSNDKLIVKRYLETMSNSNISKEKARYILEEHDIDCSQICGEKAKNYCFSIFN